MQPTAQSAQRPDPMNAAQAPSAPLPFTAGAILTAWRQISRDEWIVALIFCAAVFLMHLLALGTMIAANSQFLGFRSPLGQQLALDSIGALTLFLAVVVADRVTGRDARRRAAYVLAVVVGAALAAIVDSISLSIFWNRWEPVF